MGLGADGTRWAIATPHTAASEAGAAAFEAGGNALDAALAAATTLAVTYPDACGVGGDLFAAIQRPEGDALVVNSSGRAAAAADPEALRAAHGDEMPLRGADPVTVPGAVAGWETIHRIGATLPWADAFSAAIGHAAGGVPVARSLAGMLQSETGRALLDADPGLAGVFAPEGDPLTEGATLVQPALARTLEQLAAGGAEALYRGPVGAAYVAGLRAAASVLTADDLAAHEASIVPPLIGGFHDLHVRVAPPNSQGYSLLQILAAIERLGLDPDPTGPDAPTLARVFLTALHDVRRHLADPDRMLVHPSTLLGDGHLAAFTDEVRGELPGSGARVRPAGDTIAIVAADAEGHAISLIQSLFHGFGSGILEPVTGIVAHDRGACFTLRPDAAGAFTPGARPPHTLLPVLLHDERGFTGAAGTMGGYQQAQIDTQVIVHAFVAGSSPQEAVEAPRWVVDDLAPIGDDAPPRVIAEAGIPDAVTTGLQDAGFDIEMGDALDERAGHAHLLRRRPAGFSAGSDPRADGIALAG